MKRTEFFDRMAPDWDSTYPPELQAEAVRGGLDLLEPLRGGRILDAGCGTGIVVDHLLDRIGPEGRILAVDLSAGMLREARRKQRDPRVAWIRADLGRLILAPGRLDRIMLYNVLPHLDDRPVLARTLRGWLAPEGRILIWHDQPRSAIARIHAGAGPAVAEDVLPPPRELAGLLAGAGLRPILAEEDEAGYRVLARRG